MHVTAVGIVVGHVLQLRAAVARVESRAIRLQSEIGQGVSKIHGIHPSDARRNDQQECRACASMRQCGACLVCGDAAVGHIVQSRLRNLLQKNKAHSINVSPCKCTRGHQNFLQGDPALLTLCILGNLAGSQSAA